MPHVLSADILIVGGGVAGLWLNARLKKMGYSTLLIENGCLGGGQTVKSQGIIHGGTKYALCGLRTPASDAIANMPQRWRDALAGTDDVDLSRTRLLSDSCYLWTPGTLAGKIRAFFASKAMHSHVEHVERDALPLALQSPQFTGTAYRLDELVLDVPSLIERLATLAGDSLLATRTAAPFRQGGELEGLIIDDQLLIRAQRIVLSAGLGNAALLASFGFTQPVMQRRPLHMVLVKSPTLQPLYAHCLSGARCDRPRITVTTHVAKDGQLIWYLGGDIAEADGVARDSNAQERSAEKELQELLPWIDLSRAQWATLRVERAEPEQSGWTRPKDAFLDEQGKVLVGWPTKLALAPQFADRVVEAFKRDGVLPSRTQHRTPSGLARPGIAKPVWEELLG